MKISHFYISITFFETKIKERQNEDNLSSEQIEHLVWSQPNGKRLITGDINGNIKAWRANGKAQLQQKPAWEYAIEGGIGNEFIFSKQTWRS